MSTIATTTEPTLNQQIAASRTSAASNVSYVVLGLAFGALFVGIFLYGVVANDKFILVSGVIACGLCICFASTKTVDMVDHLLRHRELLAEKYARR